MKNLLSNLIVILIVVGVTFAGTRKFFPKTNEVVKTDTLKIDVPYEVEKIKHVEVPKRIVEYKTDTVEIEKIKLVRDTVYVETDEDIFTYHQFFLTNFTYAPRFLGIASTQGGISFTGLYPNGQTERKEWQYTPYYKIGYSDGGVALQKLNKPFSDRISHNIGAGYLQSFQQGYPYGKYQIKIDAFGVTFSGSGWLSQQPFGTIGVEYGF